VDVSGELNLSKNSSTHHSVALSKQIQAKMEGIFTTADKVRTVSSVCELEFREKYHRQHKESRAIAGFPRHRGIADGS
jgi:hypothetical protein